MSEKKDETKLDKPVAPLTLGATKSLHQRVASAAVAPKTGPIGSGVGSIPRFINFNKIFILPDCSGSMAEHVDGANATKIELLKQAVDTYLQNCFTGVNAVGVASFPEQAFASPSGDHSVVKGLIKELVADGGTPMADAMGYIHDNEQFTHAVLISDGCANDSRAVIEVANQFKVKGITCDCVHIGHDTSGETLLKEVAEITGGAYIKFTNVRAFATSFAFLAPAKRASLVAAKNPVALLGAAEVKL